jgi:hypothetical protein
MVDPGWWLSADQTAKRLDITLNHLRQLQFRKQLVWKTKQGKTVYYAEDDVTAYLEAKRVKNEVRQGKSAGRA